MENKGLVEEFLSLADVYHFQEHYSQDIADGMYFGMPLSSIVAAEKRLKSHQERCLAYFSMEYGLASSFYNTFRSSLDTHPHNIIPPNTVFSNYRLADYFFDVAMNRLIDLPIYSGGLGVLAGDTVKTMADYKMPAVAIGILWHSGYFRQRFWFKYGQIPEKIHWHPHSYPGLIPLNNIVKIELKQEAIFLRLWKYYVYSFKHDYAVPLILLDADIEQNSPKIRSLTDQLYRSDNAWIKIMQRIVLGYGGIAALRELGYTIDIFHLNEGHAAFAFVEKARNLAPDELEKLTHSFVYTCHTPVEAGHDRFAQEELRDLISDDDFALMCKFGREREGLINLTLFAMNIASSTNAVSKNHQRVMHMQFPKYKDGIRFVTNGVHPYTWISPAMAKVFKNFPSVFEGVEENPMVLSRARELKNNHEFRAQVWEAHQQNKLAFCALLHNWGLKSDAFTVCWARRIAAYKRPSLILYDAHRLVEIAKRVGSLQIVLAGKAHPNDNLAFTFINEMLDKVDALSNEYDNLKIVILENYDMCLASMLVSSVDLWLNNPFPPLEASGTSGMKAILNGVVQMSTLDGWVVEAADKGIGKIFGYRNEGDELKKESDLLHLRDDAEELYKALEEMASLYYTAHIGGQMEISSRWIDIMIDCITTGSYFNTYRMLDEYKYHIWDMK